MHSFIAAFGSALVISSVLVTAVIAGDATPTKLANPASVNCQQQGGELSIRERPDSAEYGVCVFEDNRQCEEWALLRGECLVGGIKITGYDNPAQIFCAITGGEVDMTANTCRTHQGVLCDLAAYFNGNCPPLAP